MRNPTKKQKVSPLVSEIVFGGPPLDHIEAVKWGREHEKNAREDFVRTISPRHVNFTVKTCGLHVCKEFPYIAASPTLSFLYQSVFPKFAFYLDLMVI